MKRVLLLTGAFLLVASSAMASMENVRFALHRKDKFVSTKAIPRLCDDPATSTIEANYSPNYDNIPCDQYTVTGPTGAASTVYVVVGDAGPEGIAAVSFGVDYDGSAGSGIDPSYTGWTTCADGLFFPNDGGNGDYPKPKGGARITWNTASSCGNQMIAGKVHAVVGCFYVYVYSASVLRLTPNNNLSGGVPEVAVADCAGQATDMTQYVAPSLLSAIMGRVQFGAGSQGYTPCGVVPAKPTTWGKIKSQYKAQ